MGTPLLAFVTVNLQIQCSNVQRVCRPVYKTKNVWTLLKPDKSSKGLWHRHVHHLSLITALHATDPLSVDKTESPLHSLTDVSQKVPTATKKDTQT